MSNSQKRSLAALSPTPLAMAVALAMLGVAFPALADDATPSTKTDTSKPADEVITVSGLRASKQASLKVKRNADVIEEVVTADDIGKMPDKNVADAVERLPGVQIQNGASGTGGSFDEADRVSIRSTSPSLTSTTVNGHSVSSGDWFVLDQTGLVGRSVSYSLLPSEIVGRVVVHKDPEASDQEGGAIGNVDIQTRKPLEFTQKVTAQGQLGFVHATLPNKTDPQVSGLFNWKNDDNTVGVLVQAFSEQRHLRRDGVEELTYDQIGPKSPIATANPALANVYYPEVISSALFEQERKRQGGVVDLEFKPAPGVTLDLNGFYSHMDANNINAGYMLNLGASGLISQGLSPTKYTINNGTLTSASWTPTASSYGAYDETYSRIAHADSQYIDFDGKFVLSDNTTLKTQLGYTYGEGRTDAQNMFAGQNPGSAGSYQLNGLNAPSDSVTVNPSQFTGVALNWIWGAAPSDSKDSETYGQFDFSTIMDQGPLTELKYGARYSSHDRKLLWIGQGPKCSDGSSFTWGATWCTNPAASPDNPANFPSAGVGTYPSNFGSGFGGGFINNPWLLSASALAAYDATFANRDPVSRYNWGGSFEAKENDSAAYVEGKLQGNGWGGNVGVRLVQTDEKLSIPGVPSSNPGLTPITTSAFGPYVVNNINHKFTDILPSANFRFDLNKDLVLRTSISRTMSRPDYSALGTPAAPSNDNTLTGVGGNPNLKPIRSNNVDASLEWYFDKESLLSIGLFESTLTSYVGQGVSQQVFENTTLTTQLGQPNPPALPSVCSVQQVNNKPTVMCSYNITSPVNTSGKVDGVELAYEQALGHGFGVNANLTYADARETGGHCVIQNIVGTSSSPCDLIGSSRITYNLGAYYEDAKFSSRIAYTYRGAYFTGLNSFGGPEYEDGLGTVAASFGYNITKNLAIHLDLLNLNDPIAKYYAYNKDQPLAIYDNGRQYYLSLQTKF